MKDKTVSAVKTPRMVEHRKGKRLGEMSQVFARKQAPLVDRTRHLQTSQSKLIGQAEGIDAEKPSETAYSGLLDRP
ncbi:hypothetical protein ACVW1A_004218 [Bradyrhizobium sp. LB1.3]